MTTPADVPSVARTLHVLHTNDFHGALTGAGAERLRAAVDALGPDAAYLLLDAGDAIKAGNIGVNPFGEPILALMSDVGYHAMTMGNREFHIWQSALEVKINRARFAVLCANVRRRGEERGDSGEALPVAPSHVFTVANGLRVAVLGLTVPMVTERMKMALAVSSFVFDDPVKVAERLVPELRAHADVVIALTHIGVREDERLARSVRGIDLIVGGHSHVTLPAPQVVDGTPIVQAGVYGRHYGHVTLTFEAAPGAPPCVKSALHPLEEKQRRR